MRDQSTPRPRKRPASPTPPPGPEPSANGHTDEPEPKTSKPRRPAQTTAQPKTNKRGVRHQGNSKPADPSGEEKDQTELADLPACDGVEEPVSWLWQDRLPRCTVAIIQGVKGSGKSTWLRKIAAAVTGGPALPGERRRKGDVGAVLWYAGEESLFGRVLPGLRSAGADLKRCYLADTQGDQAVTLALPNDSTRLQARIMARGVRLVVIDPLFSFLDGCTDLYADSVAARRYILSLVRVAKATGCLIILSRNCTKDTSHGALSSGRGNGELGNTARSVLHCQEIPDSAGHYGLSVASCNEGAPAPTLTYRLVLQGASPVIEVLGQSDLSADDLAGGAESATDRSLIDQAKALIRSLLTGGKLDSKIVKDKAERSMIGTRTLQAAARALGVRVQREGSREATVSYWLAPKGGWAS